MSLVPPSKLSRLVISSKHGGVVDVELSVVGSAILRLDERFVDSALSLQSHWRLCTPATAIPHRTSYGGR